MHSPPACSPAPYCTVTSLLTGPPSYPEDVDILWSERRAQRVVVVAAVSGLEVEQQVGHGVHGDVGDHGERVPAHAESARSAPADRRVASARLDTRTCTP